MAAHGKRYTEASGQIDQAKLYAVDEALELLGSLPAAKFNESVDVAVRLGVDPKHADQMVRGAIVLPHGTGRETRIVVFAKGEKEEEARAAGADFVGGDDLAAKIQDEGWLDFDRVIALIEAGKVDVTPWITHRCELKDFVARFAEWKEFPKGLIKAIVSMPEGK